MSLSVFITFNGNCRKALEYYEKAFKAKAGHVMTYGEIPKDPSGKENSCGELPPGSEKLIAFSDLEVPGGRLMLGDVPPGMPFTAGNNITITFETKDKEEIKRLYNDLKKGGSVGMELQKTFWSDLYGMVTDKFGINWQFTHDSGKY